MPKLAIFCLVLLLGNAWSTATYPQSDNPSDVFQEFASLLSHRNETTKVVVEQCVLKIETQVRKTCKYPTEPNWAITAIALNEINSLKIRPFREGVVVDIKLDVPTPSRFKTQMIKLRYGNKAAFDHFSAELDRLLNESKITSNKTLVTCTGEKVPQKRRSITLFFDSKPTMWGHFETMIQNCK
ncbi:hypothetical protein [Shimia biformata]|uniref:hypothetical protein n=1 Tax=Shimia biformata TaxID=1294299 RepID=UPI00194F9A86|nr:hypothetical protein [Shimia biformata]